MPFVTDTTVPEKQRLLSEVINTLETSLAALKKAAQDAKEYATDKDSKAESKYDTRGLEASYLAGAQAEKAESLGDAIELLRNFNLPNLPPEATLGAVVVITGDDGQDEAFFILPAGGGIELESQEQLITVISHQSPRARSLIGLPAGKMLVGGGFISEIW